MDLVFLRLDSLACLRIGPHGMPEKLQVAHLLPGLPDLPESGTPPVSEVGAPLGEDEPYRVLEFPWDRVDVDFSSLTEALEDEWSRSEEAETRVTAAEESRALLVHVSNLPKSAQGASLRELTALAETAGVQVAGTVSQRMAKPNPKTVLGKGKLADLEVAALNARAGLVLFDRELTAAQMRNLADITERKVLDRTQLILDIFAQHATSRAGKLQVEKAQMEYTLPRLVGRNKALSRLTGGIGGRGPGETKLELDRRKIRDRMTRIKDELKKLRKQRGAIRARRAKAGVPVVALVGYTNAGKSTLLNALTQSEVIAENKLFATLDPTTRRLRVPEERELILTDTVGFIRELPEELKEAFQATLEELESADLLVHVADADHPELEEQVEAVEDILRDMDLHEIPRITVLNKWDTVDDETKDMRRNRYPEAIPVSAKTGAGLDYLSREIASRVDWQVVEGKF